MHRKTRLVALPWTPGIGRSDLVMPDSIILEPRARPFDLPAMRATLLAHPAVVEDPIKQEQLLVVADEESRAHAVRRRLNDPNASIAVGIVIVREKMIHFPIDWIGPPELSIARDLAAWIVSEYQPRIFSEVVGDDWTERCAQGLEPMFSGDIPLLARGGWLNDEGRWSTNTPETSEPKGLGITRTGGRRPE